jgi:hypothetical protein
MRTVAHEMEEEMNANPIGAGAGAVAGADAEADSGFSFGQIDMNELNKMNITPTVYPDTMTGPSTKTEAEGDLAEAEAAV